MSKVVKQKSRVEYSLLNIGTNLGGYALNTLLGFVCRIVFVRILSEDYLGVSGLFTNILSMLSLTELGISSAIGYALYKPIAEQDERKIASLMRFYGNAYRIIGIVVGLVGLGMIPFLNLVITNPPDIKENLYFIYVLYLFNTAFSYFFSYRSTLLSAAQRNYLVIGYNYIVTIAQSLFQMIYLLITHEYIGYLIIQLIGGVAYNIWISEKAKRDYPFIVDKSKIDPLTKEEKKSLFINVKALTVNKLSGVLVNNTDNIAITYFKGLSTVGFASNYVIFSTTLDALITKTFNGLTGSVGNLNASKDEEERYAFFKVLNLANFWMYGWAAIGMALVSGDLVTLFYGNRFIMPLTVPLVLALNLYSIGMLHAFYTYKSTLGLFRYGQYILIFTGFINLFLDVVLGRQFGVIGIYLATFLARLATNLWYEPYAVYKYGFHRNPLEYYVRYLLYAVVLAVSGFICWSLCRLVVLPVLLAVCVKVVICSLVPNGIFILVFCRSKEFAYLRQMADRLMKKVLKKR